MSIRHPLFFGVAVSVVAACATWPRPSFANDAQYFASESCAVVPPPGSVRSACAIPVPNGDFEGFPAAESDAFGAFWHPWDPTFSWNPAAPGRNRLHSMVDHIKPWAFEGTGKPAYRSELFGRPGVVLSHEDDRISQLIPVGPWDGTQDHDVVYLVRVTYAPLADRWQMQIVGDPVKNAAMGLRIAVAGKNTVHVQEDFQDTRRASEYNPARFIAKVVVPPRTPVDTIGIGVAAGDGSVPLVIERVEVVERSNFWFDD